MLFCGLVFGSLLVLWFWLLIWLFSLLVDFGGLLCVSFPRDGLFSEFVGFCGFDFISACSVLGFFILVFSCLWFDALGILRSGSWCSGLV